MVTVDKKRSLSLTGTAKKWKTIANVGAHPTSYKLTNLSRSRTYYIRIAAENEEGVGEWRELPDPVQPTKPKSECAVFRSICPVEFVAREDVFVRRAV